MKVTVAVTAALLVGIFAVTMAPAVFAATGTFSCISPAGCSSGDVALNGPGNSVVLTYNLNTNAGSGVTMIFYVCPQTANTCSSPTGTDNGWSWSISPTSAATDASGDVNGIQLTITAPTTVTSTNTQESLVIYACSGTGTSVYCNSNYLNVASGSITATVPEFGFGFGLALAIGLLGMVLVTKKKGMAIPTVSV